METYIEKMTEIVKEHYESNHESFCPNKVRFITYTMNNYNVRAIFCVGLIDKEMCLYEVIYFPDFDKFRVFCFNYSDQFDVNGG